MVSLDASGTAANRILPVDRSVGGSEPVDEDIGPGLAGDGDEVIGKVAMVESDDAGVMGGQPATEHGGGPGLRHDAERGSASGEVR